MIIKEPSIRLLKENEEGKLDIDDGAETILALFAQMAESEMRNKQSRWQRTRRANSEKGKWNGGTKPMFGYNIGKDNFYVINEEEAQIVRILYELYTTTDMGQDRIRKEMLSRG